MDTPWLDRLIVALLAIGVALLVLALAGCTTASTLRDNLEDAADVAVNPEQRELHYIREGNVTHYLRRECSGRFCDGP